MERIVYSALCCAPQSFGLVFNKDGFVDCNLLIDSIYRKESMLLGLDDLVRIASKCNACAYEIQDGCIRINAQ